MVEVFLIWSKLRWPTAELLCWNHENYHLALNAKVGKTSGWWLLVETNLHQWEYAPKSPDINDEKGIIRNSRSLILTILYLISSWRKWVHETINNVCIINVIQLKNTSILISCHWVATNTFRNTEMWNESTTIVALSNRILRQDLKHNFLSYLLCSFIFTLFSLRVTF